MKKNNIYHISERGKLSDNHTIQLSNGKKITSNKIIIATGASPKKIPTFDIDFKQIITSKEAMVLDEIPSDLIIIGAGAIGVEFAHLYNTYGSKITLIEGLDRIVPNEDKDVSKELHNIFSKKGINIIAGAKVEKLTKSKKHVTVYVKGKKPIKADKALIAVGVTGNIDKIGLKLSLIHI